MSDPDEREFVPTKRILWTCECGNEKEDLDDPFVTCECGHVRCEGEDGCSHTCEWCNQDGCEKCMTNTYDGWAHKDECAAELPPSEDRKQARIADRIKRAAQRAADAA